MSPPFSSFLIGLILGVGSFSPIAAQEVSTFLDLPTGKLEVVQFGTGPTTVVFESGFVSDLSVWRQVAPTIAKTAKVLVYSRAGVGKSPARAQPLNLAQHTQELHELLLAAKINTPVILVGHSYGGFVVRQLAAAHPNQVAGLVLVDPAQETLEVELKKLDAAKVQQDQERLAGLAPPQAKADLALVQSLFDAGKLPNTDALPDVPMVILTSIQPARNRPFFQETAPALAVKRDLHAQFFKQFSNGAHLVTQRSGHHIQWDEPHLVISAIQQVQALLAQEAQRLAAQKAKAEARQMVMSALEKAQSSMQGARPSDAQGLAFSALKSSGFSEAEINQLGFDLLGKAKQPALAELVLRFNTEQYPVSDNAYDSHGEALLELGQWATARAQFVKAVTLGRANPQRSPKALRGFEDNLQKAEKALAKP